MKDERRGVRDERRKKSSIVYRLSSIVVLCFLSSLSFAQNSDVEFNLDLNSNTITFPKIFKPYIDLSGRGAHSTNSWPQELSAPEALDVWQNEIGFGGIYRMQYNLWEISEDAKEKSSQGKLLSNYEAIIKKISDAGGIVILDIYGTPAGLGKILDKKSPSLNLKIFKEFVKKYIRELSCKKKYNIWYEVWSAPDLDDFFLGRKQEYFGMYRAVAEAVKELEEETKVKIPLGGPAVSWWFQNCDGNSIVTPEKSFIYELIKYCYSYHLPLDFVSWHAYSTDPKAEQEITRYNKTTVALIRDWLSYFHFDKDTPLIVDEWNYDSGANLLSARKENSNICASFIPARLKNMYEAGLDYQLFFCLEDFRGNKEHVVRNVGIFWFDSVGTAEYKGGPKSIYNVLRMLSHLDKNMLVVPKTNDEFTGIIATRQDGNLTVLLYNYIDPDIARNYLSRNIAVLNDSERKKLLSLAKSDNLQKIILRQAEISKLRVSNRLKTMLKKAQELNTQADIFKVSARKIKLNIKNLSAVRNKPPELISQGNTHGVKGNYLYERYAVDSSCGINCEFKAAEEKEINDADSYQEIIAMQPYSVQMIVLKEKPKEENTVSESLQSLSQVQASEKNEEIPNKESQKTEVVPGVISNQPQIKNPGNAGDILKKKPKESESVSDVTPNNSQVQDSDKR